MRLKSLAADLAIASVLVASPALAAEHRYEPASQWQVDSEPQICRLSRQYQSGNEQLTIRMEQFQPNAQVQIMLIGKRIESASDYGSFRVRLGSGQHQFDTWAIDITLPDRRVGTLLPRMQFAQPGATANLSWPDQAQFQSINEMAFTASVMGTVVLQTQSLARAMDEMRKCHDRMIAGWGFDPLVQARLSRPLVPLGNPGKWVQPKDYPSRGLRLRRSSLVAFRLNVDSGGRPTACFVARSYNHDDFANLTCSLLMKRASFEPALDAEGKPTPSYFVSSVSWWIP